MKLGGLCEIVDAAYNHAEGTLTKAPIRSSWKQS